MKKRITDLIIKEDGTETLEMLIVTAVTAGLIGLIIYMKDKFVSTARKTTTGL